MVEPEPLPPSAAPIVECVEPIEDGYAPGLHVFRRLPQDSVRLVIEVVVGINTSKHGHRS
eukprot:CAMPEP_0180416484 /NCGR_PEP_ID=MMETSP1036_2-20121128/510_1 /TAXON_ID=632150 /ORGANISM="Azadinium spinosum, Strain 3D9" /LENGTH=59 /DNA_ID=CAMNT_0022421421 /DNA_START=36 /DNA_END=211 /DNA_ORIENTATION=-